MRLEKINLAEKYGKLGDGNPAQGIVARMNNYEIKVVRFAGDFVWHSHADTDETFIIVEGKMVMHLRDRSINLEAGELIVIPKGVEHKPSSVDGYKALLIEPEGVHNTGGVKSPLAIDKVKWV